MSEIRLFGTDGVRGIAGKYPLTPHFIRKLGAAAAAVYRRDVKGRKPFFLLGRDTRGSGPWIAKAFADGVRYAGLDVVDVGVTSTPSLAYLVPKRKAIGGVMISASHNPADFNGIKLFNPTGRKCPDTWETDIEAETETLPDILPRRKRPLRRDARGVRNYLAFLKSTLPDASVMKGLKLVIDCSNGSLSKIAPAFLKSLGIKVIPIGSSPNGKNINAGIGSQHPEVMQRQVLRAGADGGLAFDGDADRIIFCDGLGRILDGDFVIACAAHLLQQSGHLPGNKVVVTVMANLGLIKALKAWKMDVESTPVGDRFVSERLEICGGAIGGEQSGHIIFHRYLPTGDGLLTSLQILSLLRRAGKSLAWMFTLMNKYPQVLENIHVARKTPIEDCPGIQKEIHVAQKTLGEDGRVLVRYSGTEPLLRVMMEGPDETQLRELVGRIITQARKVLC